MKHLNRHFFLRYSTIFFILLQLNVFSQAAKNLPAPFTLYGKIVLDEKPVENVSLELLKDGQLLKKIMTLKNGKYSFEMNQDTVNKENEYEIHISKEGTVPKTLVVNTYIPKEEYDDEKYVYVLEITLVPTKINEIVIQRPSGKIKWNDAENNFGIDQVYAKIIQKDEEKLKDDPDKYLKELAARMKKEEEEKKKKEEEELKKKAEEEARKNAEELDRKNKEAEEELARNKENEAAELALKAKLSVITTELKELSKVNDTAEQAAKTAHIQPAIPVVENTPSLYDISTEYVIKKARVELEKRRQEEERKKSANLATKYETSNVMSSLLDAVDEHDKRMKNK